MLTGRPVLPCVPGPALLNRGRLLPPTHRCVTCMANTKTKGSKDGQVGFRWNPGAQRWDRDDRYAGKIVDMMITSKTGTPYMMWPAVHSKLTGVGLKEIEYKEARQLQQSGWTIVDVRLPDEFDKEHIAGSINIPLFRIVQGDDFWSKLKKFVMASFVMKATERNPEFVSDALKVLKMNQKVIVVCAVGGTLDINVKYRREKKIFADPERAFGRESRSLKGAYELIQGGWNVKNLLHMEGGTSEWKHQGLPMAGSYYDEE